MASQNYRVNNRIRVREVRLIDENGEQAGVVDTQDAKRRAQEYVSTARRKRTKG